MSRVMIDLESWGTTPGSIVVSIGAVEFDLERGTLGREFYQVIHAGNAQQYGLTIEAGTVLWWLGQEAEARNAIRFGGRPLRDVLQAFSDWAPKEMRPYGNGASFDLSLLKACYDAAGMKAPWKFFHERCYRTIKSDYSHVEPDERGGVFHNALDDAKFQALHCLKIRKTLEARRG